MERCTSYFVMRTRLKRDFFRQDTIEVAQQLLGQRLVHRLPSGERIAGRIVETEAYLGVEDPAAHSYGGRRTPRTEPMFGEAGLSYVYFIYGVHFCFNVVTIGRDHPEAVLIRALEPIEGIAFMQRRRLSTKNLCNGPGKLCQALLIGREQNNLDLCDSHSELFIEKDLVIPVARTLIGERVGIAYAQDAAHWPLRFGVQGHVDLSPVSFGKLLE